jgi:predicted RND superfamily exporter protein
MAQAEDDTPKKSLSFGLERIGLLPLRWPWLTGVLLVVATVAAVFGMQRLSVDDSLSELFHTDTPEFHEYQTMASRFPSSEFDVLIVIEGKNLLHRDVIEKLRNLVGDLELIPSMRGLVSLFSARRPPKTITLPDEPTVPPALFPADLPKGEAYDRLIKEVRANQIISGKLLSDDGELALILVALDREVVASQGLKDVVAEIRDTADSMLEGTGLSVKLSGAPVMQLEIRNAVQRDQLFYSGIGLVLGALIAIVFFRRVSLMIVAAVPPILGIIWSLGAFGFLGFKLNLFLNVMSPLIMAMGFTDTMQITYAIRDRLLAGHSRVEAIRWAVLVVTPAVVVTDVTAGASFITLILFSDSSLIRTFGAAGAISCLIAYVAVIMFAPFLALLLLRNEASYSGGLKVHDQGMNLLKNFCGWVSEFVARHAGIFALTALVLVVSLGTTYLSIKPRYRLADQVPDREQALAASRELDAKLTGANPIHVMIDWPADKDFYNKDVLDVIARVHAIMESLSGVGNVWSIETMRRWMKEAGETSIAKLREYIGLLPEHLVDRFLNKEVRSALVTGRIPDLDSSELRPVIEKLDSELDEVRKANPEFKIAVTGLAAVAARNSATMIETLNAGLTSEMVFVSAMVGLAFRSLLVGLAIILPNLFPIFVAGAILAVSGEGLQFASVVALTVSFGLSLDATIHYLNRLRLETREGEDPVVGVKRATVLIGPALMLTTVVLAFGLGVTMFSELPSLRLFGQLTALTLMAALTADLLILPATVLVLRRVSQRFGSARRGSATPSGGS